MIDLSDFSDEYKISKKNKAGIICEWCNKKLDSESIQNNKIEEKQGASCVLGHTFDEK